MTQFTPKLNLYKPGGGSSGTNVPDEQADIDKLNSNFDLIDAAVGAEVCTSGTRPASPYDGKIIFETDTKRLRVWRQAITTWDTIDTGRGSRTIYAPTNLADLDTIADAKIGDLAFMSTPGTGIDALKWEAFAGTGSTMDWRIIDLVVADTKANLDSFISAVAAVAGTDAQFKIGNLALVTGTLVTYRFTTAAGGITPSQIIQPAMVVGTASAGTATTDPLTGICTLAGITNAATVRLNVDKATAALARRVNFIIDVEASAGQTMSYILQLANGASINSTASSYRTDGWTVSAGAGGAYAASAANWTPAGAAKRYWTFRYEFLNLSVATKETSGVVKGSSYDAGLTNFVSLIGASIAHNLSVAADFDGLQLTFTVSGGATVSGTVRVEFEF